MTAQSKGHYSFSALITKTSFTELDDKELHFCSGLSVMLQILALSMASKRIGIPPSCLQKFLPSPVFSLQKMNTASVLKKCNFFWTIPPGKQDYLLRNPLLPEFFNWNYPQSRVVLFTFQPDISRNGLEMVNNQRHIQH